LQRSAKTKGYFALLTTSILWGTTWVASRIGVEHMPALEMASIRQLLAGSIFVLFFLLYKKERLPTGKQWRWLIIMGILMFVSANGLSCLSIQYIPAGLSALIGALYPLCVVIIEKVFYKNRKLTVLTFGGLFLAIAGIAIVFYEDAFHNARPSFLLGVFLSTVAMLTWSIGTVFLARNKMNINPYYSVGWEMLTAGVILFFITIFTQPHMAFTDIPSVAWLSIGYLVLAGSLISFVAFLYSMKQLSPAIASLYAYINPLVAMIAEYFILHEKLTANILWGSVVTLTGVFLVNYSIRRTAALTEVEM
jgi:drug/metabolite transporter (DMT)-like permease